MRSRLEPPGVPPPPEVEGLFPLPCDARKADEKITKGLVALARLQARATVWLLIALAAALVAPAMLGDYIAIAIAAFIVILAFAGAVAVRVFQALLWTAYLRNLRKAIWREPEVVRDLCRPRRPEG